MVPPRHPLRPAGFTLVEVLVAVSLVAVVGTIALLLLNSTRNVAAEVEQQMISPMERIRVNLEEELFHLHRKLPDDNWPTFELREGQSLHFTTRLPLTGDTHRLPVVCRYEPDGTSTRRSLESPYLSSAVTNRLDMIQGPLTFEVNLNGLWVRDWPAEEPDTSGHPPVLIRLSSRNTAYVLPIPAHMRMRAADSDRAE